MKHRTGHLFKRAGTFYLRWVVEGKVFSRSLHDCDGKPITDKREAEEKRVELMAPFTVADETSALESIAGKLDGRKAELAKLDDAQNPPLPLSSSWLTYEKATNRPDSGEATLETYALQWGCFVRWIQKNHKDITALRDVTAQISEEYATHLTEKKITANTFNKHIRVCELVFRVLADKAKASGNPWSHIKRKKGLLPQSRRELTTEELLKVCKSANGELRIMLALGLYLGCRLGDATTMQWSCIDLRKGCARYSPRKTSRTSGKTLTVPLHRELVGVLSETPPAERKGYLVPEMAKLYLEKGPWAVSKIVQDHFEDNGIATKRAGKGVRKVVDAGFHSLRHSAVSLLREAGAPLSVTMAIVGHSSLAVHDTYTHAGEKALRSAVDRLPAIMGGETTAKALPPPKTVDAAIVRKLAENLDAGSWEKVRDELLKLA